MLMMYCDEDIITSNEQQFPLHYNVTNCPSLNYYLKLKIYKNN